MGTNYYHETNICEHCGRYDRMHIGKSSGGWTFSFHGTETIRSWADWQKALTSGRIVDEYGETVTPEAFGQLVESKQCEPNNHVIYCRIHHPRHAQRYCWLDKDGHSFSANEFS